MSKVLTLESIPTLKQKVEESAAAAASQVSNEITAEATARQQEDVKLQNQIDTIVASSDVKDIVGTKADLNSYATSTLGNKDIIKVLKDESQNNATTYYRWNLSTFTLIGSEGPYYTKAEADSLLNGKASTAAVNEAKSAAETAQQTATAANSAASTAQSTANTAKTTAEGKQDKLVSGTNIKTVNGTSILGSGNIATATGTITGVSVNGTSVATSGVANIPAASTSAYGVTKLNNTTTSSSTAEAATANAMKSVADRVTALEGKTVEVFTDAEWNALWN